MASKEDRGLRPRLPRALALSYTNCATSLGSGERRTVWTQRGRPSRRIWKLRQPVLLPGRLTYPSAVIHQSRQSEGPRISSNLIVVSYHSLVGIVSGSWSTAVAECIAKGSEG